MASKIKTVIIFAIIVTFLVLVYVFLFKKNSDQANLTSSSEVNLSPNTDISSQNIPVDTEFLSVLLSIKNIKLNDAIFSDIAFTSLRDSSITLNHDGTEGRKNPFAPIGFDAVTPTSSDLSIQTDTTKNTSVLITPETN
ncbi:MAG: hypothetical protein AAB493_02030 [Patescibacteria group bacterium]